MTTLCLYMNDSKIELNEKHKPLLNAPPVVPLLPEHLDNAYEASEAAFQNDPMYLYLTAGKKKSPLEYVLGKRYWIALRKQQLKRKVGYTINSGDAVILSTPPDSDIGKPSPINRVIDSIFGAVKLLYVTFNRSESVKRAKEINTKMEKLIKEEIGDRAKEMVSVDLLATKPEQQGRGFGTALMDTVLFSADIRGRAVFLFSSNTANVPFYESFGFVRIAHASLGDDNPKWKKDPVLVPLMVREVKRNF